MPTDYQDAGTGGSHSENASLGAYIAHAIGFTRKFPKEWRIDDDDELTKCFLWNHQETSKTRQLL